MSLLRRSLFTLIALAALAPPARAEGLYWETTNTGGSGGPQTARFWAMPKKMKIVGDDGHQVIVRTDKETLISIDDKKKSYWEMSFTQLEEISKQMHAQMDAALAQMKDKLKDMPPEQRAMVEKMMGRMKGGEDAPPVEIKSAPETKKISGYDCKKYIATEGDKEILVAWTTDGVKGFAPMREDFIALQRRLNETNRAFRSGLAEAYAKIEGFPMETEMDQMKSTVTKVESRTIPASEFEPPSGYKKEMPPGPPKS